MKSTWAVAYRVARSMRRNGPAVYYPGGAQKWSQHVAAVVIACRMVGVVVVE